MIAQTAAPGILFPCNCNRFHEDFTMRFSASLPLAVLALASLTALAQTPSAPKVKAAPSQVAQTPPMGWNSWNYFFD